jgi:hypothetical protein
MLALIAFGSCYLSMLLPNISCLQSAERCLRNPSSCEINWNCGILFR